MTGSAGMNDEMLFCLTTGGAGVAVCPRSETGDKSWVYFTGVGTTSSLTAVPRLSHTRRANSQL